MEQNQSLTPEQAAAVESAVRVCMAQGNPFAALVYRATRGLPRMNKYRELARFAAAAVQFSGEVSAALRALEAQDPGAVDTVQAGALEGAYHRIEYLEGELTLAVDKRNETVANYTAQIIDLENKLRAATMAAGEVVSNEQERPNSMG